MRHVLEISQYQFIDFIDSFDFNGAHYCGQTAFIGFGFFGGEAARG